MPILGVIDSSKSGNLYSASYESIATVSVGSGGAANVEFTSIPQTYTHLQLRAISRGTGTTAAEEVNMNFNNDTTSSSYIYYHQLYGDGSAAVSNYAAGVTNKTRLHI